MAVTVANIEKYIAEGRVYIGATLPTTGNAPTLTAGVPASGTDVGATQGEAKFTYKAAVEIVEIEQAFTGVAPHITAEEATIELTVAEATAAQIKNAMGQTFVRTVGTASVVSVGGQIPISGASICIVSPIRGVASKYCGAMLYNAYSDAGLELSFARGAVRLVKMTFKAFLDDTLLARDVGDRLGQYFDNV